MAIKLDNVSQENTIEESSFEFQEGKITAIISEEIDKDFLLKILNDSVKQDGKYSENNIGYVCFNRGEIFLGSKVYEELSFHLNKLHYKEDNVLKRCEEALKVVSLPKEYLSRDIDTLSQSELLLLTLARCLISNPKILLIEDISSYFDGEHLKRIIKLLRKIAKNYNKTIIIGTKDVLFAYDVCDSFYMLKKEKVIGNGDRKELLVLDKEFEKAGIKIPEIINFIDYARNEKKVLLDSTYDIKELMKDVYRNAR